MNKSRIRIYSFKHKLYQLRNRARPRSNGESIDIALWYNKKYF